jgi:hypothetical protein
METREKPVARRCGHRYPIVVEGPGVGKRARCLACKEVGPVRSDAVGAMLALRAQARIGGKLGA